MAPKGQARYGCISQAKGQRIQGVWHMAEFLNEYTALFQRFKQFGLTYFLGGVFHGENNSNRQNGTGRD